MHTLIDGYNITKGDPVTRDSTLEEQRTALTRRLRARRDTLLGPGRVTIVFDGQAGVVAPAQAGMIAVRFSGGESADELLVRLAGKLAEPITLVTSDGELRERVRGIATATVTFRDRSDLFEGAAAQDRSRARKRRGIERDAGLPKGANRITQELKDLWLD